MSRTFWILDSHSLPVSKLKSILTAALEEEQFLYNPSSASSCWGPQTISSQDSIASSLQYSFPEHRSPSLFPWRKGPLGWQTKLKDMLLYSCLSPSCFCISTCAEERLPFEVSVQSKGTLIGVLCALFTRKTRACRFFSLGYLQSTLATLHMKKRGCMVQKDNFLSPSSSFVSSLEALELLLLWHLEKRKWYRWLTGFGVKIQGRITWFWPIIEVEITDSKLNLGTGNLWLYLLLTS